MVGRVTAFLLCPVPTHTFAQPIRRPLYRTFPTRPTFTVRGLFNRLPVPARSLATATPAFPLPTLILGRWPQDVVYGAFATRTARAAVTY